MENIEKFIKKAQEGDREAMDIILHSYSLFVKNIVRYYSMFLNRDDREDLYIEGLIGLQRSVLNYREAKSRRFDDFAYVSVKNAILDYLRKRKRSLQTSLSFRNDADDFKEELLLFKEDIEEFEKKLSSFERAVLELYMQGYRIKEISKRLNKNYKSIDNALQRVKRHLKEFFIP